MRITKHLAVFGLWLQLSAATGFAQADTALQTLLADSSLRYAHVGILVQEAESGKVIATHQANKYFVPASNTKLWTMYAGMKYLGDSLLAGRVLPLNGTDILFASNGDPTLLHPDYPLQPLDSVLRRYRRIQWTNAALRTTPYGNGWSWNDYSATYMTPRSSMPMYGNVVSFSLAKGKVVAPPPVASTLVLQSDKDFTNGFSVKRKFDDAYFTVDTGSQKRLNTSLYLSTEAAIQLASASFGNQWVAQTAATAPVAGWQPVYSQHTDSMLRPLMHRSDNFFAEQTLLMLSNQWFGVMDEDAVIDSLLKSDFKELPDKPRWVDGSGLSRYNLFTPADYIWLLQKMRTEFAMQRLKAILPTGNAGTLTNYYQPLEGKLFAKTGTLAGVVALSGYLYAKSGKLLLFSTLVNNHNGSAPAVRRAIEKYLVGIWEKN
jgi:D-alanyl-D-alanine carboxypeptidase/D-alanyl-D-alanine-endopeptidase (penicillin-binding protein 4)